MKKMRGLSQVDHAATICEYLNTYKYTDRGPDREKMSKRFTKYLVLACHKKILRRMTHWVARGHIYELHLTQPDTSLQDSYQPSPPDGGLASSLLGLEEGGTMLAMFSKIASWSRANQRAYSFPPPSSSSSLSSLSSPSPPSFKFSNLFSAAKLEKPVLWNKTLCVEFHMLIIAASVLYVYQLHRLADEFQHNMKDELNDCVGKVVDVARIFTAIVRSRAFKSHTDFLHRMKCLELPKPSNTMSYDNFMERMQAMLKEFEKIYDPEAEEAENAAEKDDDIPEEVLLENMVEPHSEAEKATEEDEDMLEEILLENSVDPHYIAELVQSRLKLFVGFLGAKRIMEHYCYRMKKLKKLPVTIRILEMPLPSFTPPSWSDFRDLMQDIVSYEGLNLKRPRHLDGGTNEETSFFQYIENRIIGNANPVTIFSRFRAILRTWLLETETTSEHQCSPTTEDLEQPKPTPEQDCPPKTASQYLSLHCELMLGSLAAFVKVFEGEVQDEDLREILGVCLFSFYSKPFVNLFPAVTEST